MSVYALIALVAAAASFSLGLTVWRQRAGTPLGRAFALVSGLMVVWNLHFFGLYYEIDKASAFKWANAFRWGSILLQPAVLHLVSVVPKKETRIWGLILLVDYAIGLLLVVGDQQGLIVEDLRKFPWGYYSVGGPWYGYFTLYVFANSLAAILALTSEYHRCREPLRRIQLRFWTWGAYVGLTFAATNLLPAYGVSFYPLGNLGNVAWVGIMAYAILRHRLMDIDLAIARGASYAGVFLLVLMPAFALVVIVQQRAFGAIHLSFSLIVLLMLVVVGLGFNAVKSSLESRIGSAWFPEKYEYRSTLISFTKSIVRMFDEQRIVRELGVTLSNCLHLDTLAIVLKHPSTNQSIVEFGIGLDPGALQLDTDSSLMRLMEGVRRSMLKEEISRQDPAAAAILHRYSWTACIPMISQDRVVGLIGLGQKRDLSVFYAEDLELLEILACEAAVAIENARLYDALRRSHDIIRRADRSSALGVLAAGIAHEIRNPLVSIQTFFQLAPDRLNDNEFMTTFLQTAAGEVKRISRLINELLSFARSPQKIFKAVSLNELVEGVFTLLGPEARKRQVQLQINLSRDKPFVEADFEQIRQVLVNITFNGIQATSGGGVVQISTNLVNDDNQPFGRIEVCDNGAGISPNRLESIFDPFFTTKDTGTGLGLAIARQIVTEHGGRISVDSEPGRGSTFVIDLPRVQPASLAAGAQRLIENEWA